MIENNDVRLSQGVCCPMIASGNLSAHRGNITTLKLSDSTCNAHVSTLSILYNTYYFGKGYSQYTAEPVKAPLADDDTVYEAVKNEESAEVGPLAQIKNGKDLEEAMFNEGLFCFYDVLSVARQNNDM